MYKNDKITETEYKKIGQPLKRYQNVRRKIVKLIQTSFDNQQDFMKAEKEAGVNLKDFR
jgi:DNA-binding cell septation regulator SpoVG